MLDYKIEVPFFDAASQYLSQKDEIDAAIQKVLLKGAFINGPEVAAFSSSLASYLNINYVTPCGNGTDALYLALMALGLQNGDEVIIPAFNYIAVAEAIALLGLVPVFVDVNEDDFNISHLKIEERISAKTKAIVVVHLFGLATEIEQISRIAKKYDLYVVEDVAQSLGSTYKGTKLGTFGHIGCTSFFPTKNLACFGDGGAVFTNDSSLAERLRMMANHGQSKKYEHELIGLNSRLDTLQAAVLNIQLPHLDDFIARRKAIAQRYHSGLSSIEHIRLPRASTHAAHTFNQYCIVLVNEEERSHLMNFLKENGIATMIYYPKPIHLQKAFLKYRDSQINLSVSEDICTRILALPIFPTMNEVQQDYIIENIKIFFNKNDN